MRSETPPTDLFWLTELSKQQTEPQMSDEAGPSECHLPSGLSAGVCRSFLNSDLVVLLRDYFAKVRQSPPDRLSNCLSTNAQ